MYRPRLADTLLAERLETTGAVVIDGPKACGKTETARQFAASEVLIDIDEARLAAKIDPSLILAGKVPRLLDEWQLEPGIWNHVRRAIDNRGEPGQFILTGSAMPADDISRHTGAGRFSRIRLRTMSLYEQGVSNGLVSLQKLFAGEVPSVADPGCDLATLVEHICAGGWPGHMGLSLKAVMRAQRDYLNEVQRVDMVRVDNVRRAPYIVERILRSLARNVATTVNVRTLATDVSGADGLLDDNTVRDHLRALDKIMILEEQPAWSPHLRSRSTLRKMPKRHLTDPALAVAALGATPGKLLKDLKLLGCLFESLVFRDLSIYAQQADAKVFHYRDNTGLEVDAIVEDMSGNYCAFEVKLGAGQVDNAAKNLLKFGERIDPGRSGATVRMAVITATGYGYMRPDGVAVIPVTALGP